MQTLHERKADISIIVPVYNLERFLDPLLESLKEQELDGYRMEVIMVLNNCTDGSEDVIRQSGLECQILNCSIQGCGPARNAALDIASGEYIWMMDGDDWLTSKTAIRDILDRAKKRKLNIMRIPFRSARFGGNYYSMVWQYVFRHEFIKEFRFPDYQPGEDGAYMDMVLEKAGYDRHTFLEMPCIQEPQYNYNYLREGSNMYRFIVKGERI